MSKPWHLYYWRNEGGEENYQEARAFDSVADALAHAAYEAVAGARDPEWCHFYLERVDHGPNRPAVAHADRQADCAQK